jgi:Ca2+-binding RTX toxin-like protein
MDAEVTILDNDEGRNTAPSAMAVAKDTYDTDLSLNVAGFGSDVESGVTYEIVTQPTGGTVTLNADGSFHFEGNPEFLDALKRGEIKPVTFQYQVSDGELTSEPATITINVHGTDPGDETIQAFTRTIPSQTDFFPLDGKDGNDTVVFNSVTLTSGTGLEISLGDTIKWTEYNLKPIVNIENITIKDTNGNVLRTMTVGGDDQANVITIENTNHKLTILGRGGDDTINFNGTGNGLISTVNGGAGNDTVNAHSAVTVNVAEGNDTVNVFNGSNVTVQSFTQGDKIAFAAGIQATNVSAAVVAGNTILTVNQDSVTSTVTVKGTTSLVAGTDWTAEGPSEPANQAPVAGDVTIDNLTEDSLFAVITPSVTDADGNPITIKAVGALPTGVTLDAANQGFVFNGNPATFDAMNTGDVQTISFQYVANDGIEDSAPATVTITIAGITDQTAAGPDPVPAQFADQYNYDQGNGGPAGRSTAGDDILNDGAGLASTINGLGGNDTIYGKDGNDTNLVGGTGSDTIHGGSGNDQLTGDGGPTDTNTPAGANNVGAPGADSLYGGDGNDIINGQDGNDVLVGGHGADNLTGGMGDDTFVFLDIFDRGDTITMQAPAAGNDVFDFRSFDFSPNELGPQDPVNGLRFLNEAPVEGQMLEDAFYYNSATGRLSLNTGADGLEDFYVTLQLGNGTRPQLTADDFLI